MNAAHPHAPGADSAACCHAKPKVEAAADSHCASKASAKPDSTHHTHHGHAAHGGGLMFGLTTSATIHCLTGCAIGEFIGLAIGVSLGLNPWATMALATALGFASGYTLGLWPLVKQGMSWDAAFETLWLGETISIAVMEFAMNVTDYHVGGVTRRLHLRTAVLDRLSDRAARRLRRGLAGQLVATQAQHQAALPLRV